MTKEIVLNESALKQVPTGDFIAHVFFPNGHGISVIRHYGSYGYKQGLFEAAHIVGSPDAWEFVGEPEGWQTPADVVALATKIRELLGDTEELENKGVQELE